jgi:hypothetical protein
VSCNDGFFNDGKVPNIITYQFNLNLFYLSTAHGSSQCFSFPRISTSVLLAAGADANIKDMKGSPPLEYALQVNSGLLQF